MPTFYTSFCGESWAISQSKTLIDRLHGFSTLQIVLVGFSALLWHWLSNNAITDVRQIVSVKILRGRLFQTGKGIIIASEVYYEVPGEDYF